MVHAGVVVQPVGNQVDGLQLVGVPGGEDDFVGVQFAEALDLGKRPDASEVDFVEENRLLGAVVELANAV